MVAQQSLRGRRARCPGLKGALQADPDPAVWGGGHLSLWGRWPGLKSCCVFLDKLLNISGLHTPFL